MRIRFHQKRGVFVKPTTESIYERYRDRLFSIAYTVCQNREDAEDVTQEIGRASCRERVLRLV